MNYIILFNMRTGKNSLATFLTREGYLFKKYTPYLKFIINTALIVKRCKIFIYMQIYS